LKKPTGIEFKGDRTLLQKKIPPALLGATGDLLTLAKQFVPGGSLETGGGQSPLAPFAPCRSQFRRKPQRTEGCAQDLGDFAITLLDPDRKTVPAAGDHRVSHLFTMQNGPPAGEATDDIDAGGMAKGAVNHLVALEIAETDGRRSPAIKTQYR